MYLINRYYDPTTDQFLSVDPKVSQTDQPYVFTNDSPLNATDPLGLFRAGIGGQLCGGGAHPICNTGNTPGPTTVKQSSCGDGGCAWSPIPISNSNQPGGFLASVAQTAEAGVAQSVHTISDVAISPYITDFRVTKAVTSCVVNSAASFWPGPPRNTRSLEANASVTAGAGAMGAGSYLAAGALGLDGGGLVAAGIATGGVAMAVAGGIAVVYGISLYATGGC